MPGIGWKGPRPRKFTVDLRAGNYGDRVQLDSYTWWMASHCGPGSTDKGELCGFCAEPQERCAQNNTDSIKISHKQWCGGSGFWCPSCGLFWAQNICGELFNAEFRNANPELRLTEKDGKVLCSCGEYLFDFEDEELIGNE
jgi:hypothetical protein